MSSRGVTIQEVYTTLPTLSAAQTLAAAIVEQRLAACVQITGPVCSIYRWKGSVNQDQEYVLRCKTVDTELANLTEYLKSNHPYELPEIIWSTVQASPEYAEWVEDLGRR